MQQVNFGAQESGVDPKFDESISPEVRAEIAKVMNMALNDGSGTNRTSRSGTPTK